MALSEHVRSDLRRGGASVQLGTFWLPDSLDHQVNGVIEVDSDNIGLQLHGGLRPDGEVPNLRQDITYPVIHGVLENPRDDCTLYSSWGWFELPQYAPLQPRACVRGSHLALDEPVAKVRLQFDGSHILSPHAFRVAIPGDQSGVRNVTVTGEPGEITADAPGMTIRIRPAVSLSGGYSSVEMRRVASILAELDPPKPFGEAIDSVHLRFRHLLAVLRGSNAELLSIQALPAAETLSERDIAHGQLPLEIDVPHLAAAGAKLELGTAHAELLFGTLEARDFATGEERFAETIAHVVGAWCRAFVDENTGDACDAANRTATVNGRTSVQLFVDYFAAVEILAQALKPKSKSHKARVKRLMAFIPSDDKDRSWAEERLRSGGGWSLRTSLRELARATPLVDSFVDDEFIESCVSDRSAYSHGRMPQGRILRTAGRLRSWFLLRVFDLGGAPSAVLETFARKSANRFEV